MDANRCPRSDVWGGSSTLATDKISVNTRVDIPNQPPLVRAKQERGKRMVVSGGLEHGKRQYVNRNSVPELLQKARKDCFSTAYLAGKKLV
jgi:hypothetical protein